MDLSRLIEHPEQMNKETLYELRSFVALYPYFQAARLLMLQNLYLLHDTSFDEELRRAAIYLTDRRVIFNLVEAAHFEFKKAQSTPATEPPVRSDESRTLKLIDNFLESIPTEEEPETPRQKRRRKPTPADAAVDYVRYLIDMEDTDDDPDDETQPTPQLKGQDLIDTFINKEGGKIQLKDQPEYLPQAALEPESHEQDQEGDEEGIFTETLAKIYIKQGRYDKALEIIQRLNLNYPKKNAYFADQIRFLRKLIINNNINK